MTQSTEEFESNISQSEEKPIQPIITLADYEFAQQRTKILMRYILGTIILFAVFFILFLVGLAQTPPDNLFNVENSAYLILSVATLGILGYLIYLYTEQKKIINKYELQNLPKVQRIEDKEAQQEQLEKKYLKAISYRIDEALKKENEEKIVELAQIKQELNEKNIKQEKVQKDKLLETVRQKHKETYNALIDERKKKIVGNLQESLEATQKISLKTISNYLEFPVKKIRMLYLEDPKIEKFFEIEDEFLILRKLDYGEQGLKRISVGIELALRKKQPKKLAEIST